MSPPFRFRIKKFLSNPLLERKQFALEVDFEEGPNVSKENLRAAIAKTYKVPNPNCIILFGFKTHFGGGKMSGFGLIYDNFAACERYEKKYRLIRMGVAQKETSSITRRAKKDIKNRKKKVRGKEKSKVSGAAQKK